MGKAGGGEEGSDAAFFMPHKNRARREKSNVPLRKEGGKSQIKDMNFFLQDRLLNRLFLFTEVW